MKKGEKCRKTRSFLEEIKPGKERLAALRPVYNWLPPRKM
jgi:hypothetical protein